MTLPLTMRVMFTAVLISVTQLPASASAVPSAKKTSQNADTWSAFLKAFDTERFEAVQPVIAFPFACGATLKKEVADLKRSFWVNKAHACFPPGLRLSKVKFKAETSKGKMMMKGLVDCLAPSCVCKQAFATFTLSGAGPTAKVNGGWLEYVCD